MNLDQLVLNSAIKQGYIVKEANLLGLNVKGLAKDAIVTGTALATMAGANHLANAGKVPQAIVQQATPSAMTLGQGVEKLREYYKLHPKQ